MFMGTKEQNDQQCPESFMYNSPGCDDSNTTVIFLRVEHRRTFVFVNTLLLSSPVCVCVSCDCAEVLNNDGNSRYMLMSAVPMALEGNTIVSMATLL